MAEFKISGRRFDLDPHLVEARCVHELPDPVQEHYVVISGRRFPPKQVLSCVTGLDRADFTTHQARRVLKRLGFVAARVGRSEIQPTPEENVSGGSGDGPHQGAQAAALEPFVGKWVALAGPTDVLVAADSPQDVLAWLARHEKRAPFGMFRVPSSVAEAEGVAPE
jgi:hypothetical protein